MPADFLKNILYFRANQIARVVGCSHELPTTDRFWRCPPRADFAKTVLGVAQL